MSQIDILTPDEIETLRAGYSYETMRDAFTKSLIEPYAPAGGWVAAMTNHFFDHEADPDNGCPTSPANRERVLLGVLCPQGGSELAIHIYWAMMVNDGLSPAEIADIFYLAGAYHGVDAWREGLKTLIAVQQALKVAVGEGHTTTGVVLGRVADAGTKVH